MNKEKEINDTSKRFLEVISTKLKLAKHIVEFSEIITPAKITHIRSKRNDASTDLIEELLRIFPDVDRVWLLTGKGEMLKGETNSSKQKEQTISEIYQEGAVPIYDMEVNAGMVSRIIDDNNGVPIAGWLYLKDHPNTTGLIGVKAVGDSMATFINGGDIMLIRKLENYNFIPPGFAYVVISDELSIVKYVRNGKDDDHWTLRSHNDKYEDFPVRRIDVKHLFIVVKVIKELNY